MHIPVLRWDRPPHLLGGQTAVAGDEVDGHLLELQTVDVVVVAVVEGAHGHLQGGQTVDGVDVHFLEA